uniref:SUN domain-containing protein n=1 Tax=Hanusia phi TaxID=3032 RepID=A0A7S0EXU0_9CRYP|mmetsp:Transcript_34/g.94  ORF Transcript_34/g.94 Transcript_34/m.94 type:complete len:148 (+) Transcript_34:43-486(+)
MESLLGEVLECKVSSSISKEFSKDKMLQSDLESCWQSKQGRPQSVTLELTEPRLVEQLHLQFQGGFAAKEIQVHLQREIEEKQKLQHVDTLYPEDNNEMQKFELSQADAFASKRLKLIFPDSTDLFGRVIIYRIDIIGTKSVSNNVK